MQSLYIDPIAGGYIRQGNTLEQAPSAVVKANMLLLEPIGGNLYITGGNPLLSLKTIPTRTEVVNGVNSCLSPLIDSGDLVTVTVTDYTLTAFEKPKVTIQILLPSGETAQLTWKQ